MRVIFLSFFLIFTFTACSDDVEFETEAQLTAKRLKADINTNATNIVSIYVLNFSDASLIFSGSSYEITSDGFIVITSDADVTTTYNLGEIKNYIVTPSILALYY